MVVLAAIILITFEIFLRIEHFHIQKALLLKYGKRDLCLKKHHNLLYIGVPGRNGLNSQGFFDCEHKFLKPLNVFRVVIIGDSVAEGMELDLNESFGRALERKLNTTYRKKVEVITLATGGYSTVQELILLKDQAFRYSPDLIIWSYVLNDPAHPVFHNANGELGKYFYQPRLFLLHFMAKKLFYFKENIKAKCMHCKNKGFEDFLHCVYWNQVKLNIKRIGEVCRKNNIPIIFLIHPVFEEGKAFAEYSLISLHDKLKNLAADYGLIPLDLLKAYNSYSAKNLSLDYNGGCHPWHPNAKGHEIAAEYIYLYLTKSASVSGG